MSEHLVSLLDLTLAWRRLKLDFDNRVSFCHPILKDLIELDLDSWLATIKDELARDVYRPSPPNAYEMPKGKWLVRPGVRLSPKDELIYTALVGAALPHIEERVRWARGDPDVSYQLVRDPRLPAWVNSGFRVWAEWRTKSLAKLGQSVQYVVFADISAFYENIDYPKLASYLREIGVGQEVVSLLTECLWVWSLPRGKGLPQGYTPSDILAKLYLAGFDLSLKNEGHVHLRYVDDIRVFCANLTAARQSLVRVSHLLRLRGLNAQSAKTAIHDAAKARLEIDGVAPVIEVVVSQLLTEVREERAFADPYLTLARLEKLVEATPESPPREVLEQAFRDHFLSADDDSFNKTLFHYLLIRLGAVHSRVAVDYALNALLRRPEETEYVLAYLKKLGPAAEDVAGVIEHLFRSEAIYDYQIYQILRWLHEIDSVDDRVLERARHYLDDRNRAKIVRAYAIAILGTAGNAADLERLQEEYAEATDELQRAEILWALRRMETAARNGFYGRFADESELTRRAERLVRERT